VGYLVLDLLEGREGLRELARKHGVSHSLIRQWIQKCETGQLMDELDPTRPDLLPLEISAILGHELCHAAVGIAARHGKLFAKAAKALGLIGPMKSTTASPKFIEAITPILALENFKSRSEV
jgi:transposase-like protein